MFLIDATGELPQRINPHLAGALGGVGIHLRFPLPPAPATSGALPRRRVPQQLPEFAPHITPLLMFRGVRLTLRRCVHPRTRTLRCTMP